MTHRGPIAVAVLLSIGVFSGCATDDSSGDVSAAAVGDPAGYGSGRAPVTGLLMFDTGAESTPAVTLMADWAAPVNSPLGLREFASSVIAGKVVAVEGSWVDPNGGIVTTYVVQVEKVLKGEGLPGTIPVTLPGGTVPLGEYIEGLDRGGHYAMKLGSKDPTLFPGTREEDARTMDPATPISENRGTNPTSESLITAVQPDSWVFFIGSVEGGVNYGAAFDHALAYLKDGLVYSLHPEAVGWPISESDLMNGRPTPGTRAVG